MRQQSPDKLRDTLEAAGAGGWLANDAARLLVELGNAGVQWQATLDECVKMQREKIRSLKAELARNSYQRYLDGGPKPRTSNGRLDWKARDSHSRLQRSIQELEALLDRFLGQFHSGDPQGLRQWNSVSVALEVQSLLSDLQATATATLRSQPTLSGRDYQLCLAWARKGFNSDSIDLASLNQSLGTDEALRLISARAAELCVSSYYLDLGQPVEDVSVRQLDGFDERWCDFDLLVAGRPIDVKNARRQRASFDSYVEHAVPAFKLDRSSGADVVVAGTLSDRTPRLADAEPGLYVQVLGEISLAHLRRLIAWVHDRFGHILDLGHLLEPKFYPGWIFDYPHEHYPHRADAIKRIPEILRNALEAGFPPDSLVGWLTTLCPDSAALEARFLSADHEQVRADLKSLGANVGLSRPGIYLYVMGRILDAIVRKVPLEPLATALNQSLFGGSGKAKTCALGLEDSQDYVLHLLNSLVVVYREVIKRDLHFTSFKLTHPQILRGLTPQGTLVTLLAYCGGWLQEPLPGKCGNTHLVLGNSDPCGTCGYLICGTCGFCSGRCSLVRDRQERIAQKRRRPENA